MLGFLEKHVSLGYATGQKLARTYSKPFKIFELMRYMIGVSKMCTK